MDRIFFLLDDARLSDVRSHLIGFIFQSYNLVNRMSVQENVGVSAIFSERPSSLIATLGTGIARNPLGIKGQGKAKTCRPEWRRAWWVAMQEP